MIGFKDRATAPDGRVSCPEAVGDEPVEGRTDSRDRAALVSRDDGLNVTEGAVMDALIDAVDAFSHLERQHPDEMRDFVDGIHRCQYLLALRVARREFPVGWPVKT